MKETTPPPDRTLELERYLRSADDLRASRRWDRPKSRSADAESKRRRRWRFDQEAELFGSDYWLG